MTPAALDPHDVERLFAAITPVADRLATDGHDLYLVGGVVRDLLLGAPVNDVDLTTAARPAVIKQAVKPLASALWTQGERFGTIGAEVNGLALEITTHRAEEYDAETRKPVVTFGDDLITDLSRRDFTINAIALSVPTADGRGAELHDPYDGQRDLEARVLRTPLDPAISFTDDPLRMMRAARFIPRFDLRVAPDVRAAVVEHGHRLSIVSRERVHDELERLLALDDPGSGLDFLADTGLLTLICPWMDPPDRDLLEGVPSLTTRTGRRAALISATEDDAAWLRHWKYSTDDAKRTQRLRRASQLLGSEPTGALSDASIRRAASLVGSGELLDESLRLALLTHDAFDGGAAVAAEAKTASLRASEDLDDLTPAIGGQQIMNAFDVEPGPILGRATKYLTELRIIRGPMSVDESLDAVREWLPTQTIA